VNDEKELVDRLSRGDLGAFQELVEQHKKKVYYIALDIAGNHADAEDISQEVFLKVFRSFKTFRRGARISSWLYRVAVNASIDHLRRKSAMPDTDRRDFLHGDVAEFALPSHNPESDPARRAEGQMMRAQIDKALQKISDQERSVFVLRHYHDLSLKEIAAVMKVSLGSVKSYLFRGLKKLQVELAAAETGPGLEVRHE
jgi:RNA polymerase sigma-70 factor (ECF subfamily)